MAYPAYASARQKYLVRAYNIIPRIITFESNSRSEKPIYKDTERAKLIKKEIVAINVAYMVREERAPRSDEQVSRGLAKRQKDAIARAIKQEKEGRI